MDRAPGPFKKATMEGPLGGTPYTPRRWALKTHTNTNILSGDKRWGQSHLKTLTGFLKKMHAFFLSHGKVGDFGSATYNVQVISNNPAYQPNRISAEKFATLGLSRKIAAEKTDLASGRIFPKFSHHFCRNSSLVSFLAFVLLFLLFFFLLLVFLLLSFFLFLLLLGLFHRLSQSPLLLLCRFACQDHSIIQLKSQGKHAWVETSE